MALNSIADTKTGNPEIWMVAFNDRYVINALWNIPEGMDFCLVGLSSIHNNVWYTVDT